MITILYVDENDLVASALYKQSHEIKIHDLISSAYQKALQSDKVIYEYGAHKYVLKDRGR